MRTTRPDAWQVLPPVAERTTEIRLSIAISRFDLKKQPPREMSCSSASTWPFCD